MKDIENIKQFAKLLKQDKPILLDFYADWCGPCQTLLPIVDDLAKENKDFRIEGYTDTEIFMVDASADAVGISTTTPASGLDVQTSMGLNITTITSATTLDQTHNVILCNTAPNIVFPKSTLYPNKNFTPTQLSDIKSPYTLVVFGASWCPKCKEEIPEIAKHYQQWKNSGLEVVFVSLDENEFSFINFAASFPFISMCDYQKWNSPIAQNYHVFGTPTMYLLDNTQKIILRPNSTNQINTWVDWYLVKGKTIPKE